MPANNDQQPAPDLNRALVLAPLRKDSSYVAELLSKHSIETEVCDDARRLETALADTPGLLIATHEALTESILDCVGSHLRAQPDWSELPIIVLVDQAATRANIQSMLAARWPRSRLVFYQRPVATLELLSGVQSLLLARHRQREVRDHLERELELRRELNHRVKNILASVLSIVHLTKRSAASTDQMATDLEGRLTALAQVHSAVFRAGGETVQLSDVVATTFAPYADAGERSRVSAKGPQLTISRDSGTALALCLHELVTNALKYGALSVDQGHVSLRWRISGRANRQFHLEWVESGGPSVGPPARVGYGTRYVRVALAGLLGNAPTIEFDEAGLRLTASGPVSRLTAAE
jgi:two-component sensor histidine kinase